MQSIEKNLPSGVKVVINVDRRLPIACVAHLFGVGYVHEPDHLVGISHFLEHLCFKRSSVKNLGQLINDFRSIGAVLEAGTAYDHTYFSCLVPSQNLSSALRMQSEMVRALDFSSDEIESEKEVVMHELDQKLDQPSRYLWEKLLALSFEVHPIKRWRMGQKSQILSITAEDVVAFHRQHYQPENLVISVVGNVNPEQVIEEISLMYPGDRNDRKENTKLLDPFQESPQTQARLARYEGKLSHALIQLGFKAPSFSHKDQVAMECLHVLLGKEKQSRLYESLVRKELAFTVDTSYFSSRDVGFVAIKADVTPSKMSILEEVIFLELDRLCRHSPSLTELNSAKKMILSSWANEKEDLHNTTYKLAYMKLMEQVSKPKKDYDQLERLQVQDISRVAQEYLTFSQANIVEYVPDESGPGAFPQWRIESLAKRIENQKTKDSSIVEESTNQSEVGSANEGFEEIFLATRNEKESTIFWEDLHIHQLSFGAQLIHLPKTHTATGFISLGFPGGRLHENQKNAGITNFMLQCCAAAQKEKQNTGIPKSSIHQNLDVEASADFFYASTETFHCEFESSLEQLIETLKCRDFSPHVIENQKLRNRLT
ncbi:MAG: insulinase family protein, partial [Bdellovibrionales bacterium]|nr:insulinase family protein [Bdellovibrionales bacterium]